ncbi:hypothetical protein CSV67_02770 [Sporosarcina sp. P2]|uniref:hypothetical protein n=1 Tax=Sporosarcina sp. P2 TaxID=2048251 RepID=UPI000C16AAC4|nr:hypothetical protein [Sporosarcina sp. P2]PID03582.1 hypothetical protein CSV67_02770 [Sporosarcina sp. P2]
MTSQIDARKDQNERVINVLNKLQGATSSSVEPEVKKKIAEDFFSLLNELPFDLLPYAAVSQFIYNDDSPDIFYFIENLEEMITEEFADNPQKENYKKGIKMIEHMELAKQQKDNLYEKHEKDIQRIKTLNSIFAEKSSQITKIQEMTEELQEDNRRMVTNYISILGIFAAILMGAFGAIQGFASLFNNAHELNLGTLLIISSIGASSVLLILFFLLNGIAKLTGKNLSSTNKADGTLLEKHPSLAISHGILIFIALIGASIILSNIRIQFAWSGLWWILPFLWFIYLIIALSNKKLVPSFVRQPIENEESEPISEGIKKMLPK